MKRRSPTEASKGRAPATASLRKKPESRAAAPQSPVHAEPRHAESAARSDGQSSVSAAERAEMIARLAYLRSEKRGFRGGSPLEDWLQAEAEVDAQLARAASEAT